MRSASFATLALTALTLAAPTPSHARVWAKAWNVSGSPNVHVVTNDGRVRIHRGPAGKVSTHILYEVHVWGLGNKVREPKIVLEQDGNAIRVDAREQSNWVMFGGMDEKFEIDVTVPENCDLQVRTGDGSVTCDPLTGRIQLETADGRIRASGLKGSIVLWTGDGGVDADSLDGSLMAHTGDGHLKVGGRFDNLDLRTGDGRLEANVRRGSQPASAWSFETGDGSLTVRIPRNLSALLDATTRDGSLRVELPITTRGMISGHNLHGELNGGSVPMRMRSGDGSILLALSE